MATVRPPATLGPANQRSQSYQLDSTRSSSGRPPPSPRCLKQPLTTSKTFIHSSTSRNQGNTESDHDPFLHHDFQIPKKHGTAVSRLPRVSARLDQRSLQQSSSSSPTRVFVSGSPSRSVSHARNRKPSLKDLVHKFNQTTDEVLPRPSTSSSRSGSISSMTSNSKTTGQSTLQTRPSKHFKSESSRSPHVVQEQAFLQDPHFLPEPVINPQNLFKMDDKLARLQSSAQSSSHTVVNTGANAPLESSIQVLHDLSPSHRDHDTPSTRAILGPSLVDLGPHIAGLPRRPLFGDLSSEDKSTSASVRRNRQRLSMPLLKPNLSKALSIEKIESSVLARTLEVPTSTETSEAAALGQKHHRRAKSDHGPASPYLLSAFYTSPPPNPSSSRSDRVRDLPPIPAITTPPPVLRQRKSPSRIPRSIRPNSPASTSSASASAKSSSSKRTNASHTQNSLSRPRVPSSPHIFPTNDSPSRTGSRPSHDLVAHSTRQGPNKSVPQAETFGDTNISAKKSPRSKSTRANWDQVESGNQKPSYSNNAASLSGSPKPARDRNAHAHRSPRGRRPSDHTKVDFAARRQQIQQAFDRTVKEEEEREIRRASMALDLLAQEASKLAVAEPKASEIETEDRDEKNYRTVWPPAQPRALPSYNPDPTSHIESTSIAHAYHDSKHLTQSSLDDSPTLGTVGLHGSRQGAKEGILPSNRTVTTHPIDGDKLSPGFNALRPAEYDSTLRDGDHLQERVKSSDWQSSVPKPQDNKSGFEMVRGGSASETKPEVTKVTQDLVLPKTRTPDLAPTRFSGNSPSVHLQNNRMTMDSDSYSTVNRVLDQYHDSNLQLGTAPSPQLRQGEKELGPFSSSPVIQDDDRSVQNLSITKAHLDNLGKTGTTSRVNRYLGQIWTPEANSGRQSDEFGNAGFAPTISQTLSSLTMSSTETSLTTDSASTEQLDAKSLIGTESLSYTTKYNRPSPNGLDSLPASFEHELRPPLPAKDQSRFWSTRSLPKDSKRSGPSIPRSTSEQADLKSTTNRKEPTPALSGFSSEFESQEEDTREYGYAKIIRQPSRRGKSPSPPDDKAQRRKAVIASDLQDLDLELMPEAYLLQPGRERQRVDSSRSRDVSAGRFSTRSTSRHASSRPSSRAPSRAAAGLRPRTPHQDTHAPEQTENRPSSGAKRFEPVTPKSNRVPQMPSIPKHEISSPVQKRLTRRRHIIKELIDTEHSFCQDMRVVTDIYRGTSNVIIISAEDVKTLFSNSGEIVSFSTTFLDALKAGAKSVYILSKSQRWKSGRQSETASRDNTTTGDESSATPSDNGSVEKDARTYIGEVFGDHMRAMETVYTDYLKNHDAANQKLALLQKNPKVQIWLKECKAYASDLTAAWDLDSLLVKPVQRILKYPLLLDQLLQSTPIDHPDHAALARASHEMKVMSMRINETQKEAQAQQLASNTSSTGQISGRKRKDSDMRNGLAKAFGRRAEKIKNQLSAPGMFDDRTYSMLSDKYAERFVHLQVVLRDFEMYTADSELFVRRFCLFSESIESFAEANHTSYLEIESKWRDFRVLMQDFSATALPLHLQQVRTAVIQPITTLVRLYDGPQKLMIKRDKRLTDYARYKAIVDRGDKPDKKLMEQGEQFQHLNTTLKYELPKLFTLTGKLLGRCLASFVFLQQTWAKTWQAELKKSIENIGQVISKSTLQEGISEIERVFQVDFATYETQMNSLGIANGSFLQQGSTSGSKHRLLTTTPRSHLSGEGPSPPAEIASTSDPQNMILGSTQDNVHGASEAVRMKGRDRARSFLGSHNPPASATAAEPGLKSNAATSDRHFDQASRIDNSVNPSNTSKVYHALTSNANSHRSGSSKNSATHMTSNGSLSTSRPGVYSSSRTVTEPSISLRGTFGEQAGSHRLSDGASLGQPMVPSKPQIADMHSGPSVAATTSRPITRPSSPSAMVSHSIHAQQAYPLPGQQSNQSEISFPTRFSASHSQDGAHAVRQSSHIAYSRPDRQSVRTNEVSEHGSARSSTHSNHHNHRVQSSHSVQSRSSSAQTYQSSKGAMSIAGYASASASATPHQRLSTSCDSPPDLPTLPSTRSTSTMSTPPGRVISLNGPRQPSAPSSPLSGSEAGLQNTHDTHNTIVGSPNAAQLGDLTIRAPTITFPQYNVIFLAASVYEFNIDRARKEAGFPYLTYVAGEIFDVIGERGELWLARNQDDANSEIGWIWNKHFVKLAG